MSESCVKRLRWKWLEIKPFRCSWCCSAEMWDWKPPRAAQLHEKHFLLFCTCSLSQNPECLILYSHHALLLSGGERIELKIAHVHHLLAAGRPFLLSHFWAKLIAVPLAKSQQKLKTPSSRRESVCDSVTELHAPPNNLDTNANYPAS